MLEIRKRIIPNCLRSYRKARGLLQKEVAAILGMKSASIVSRWENGACLPKPLTMFKLAVLYRTMADALFIDLRRALKDDLLAAERAVVEDRVVHDNKQEA